MSESGYIPQPPVARVRQAASEAGALATALHMSRWAAGWVAGLPRARPGAGPADTFSFAGESYPYLFHRYKHSWLTERAVEVPVVARIVEAASDRRVLEVGHVLGHYRPHAHPVVDKYERAPGVINRDVLDLEALGEFDLIVAISTLEHVGQDEEPREPGKAVRAALALRERLAPGGQLLLTVPIGYNAAFDTALRDGTIPLARTLAMRRVGRSRRWREVEPATVWDARYDWLLYAADGVLFGWIDAA